MKQECTIVGISNAEFSEMDGKFNGTETLTKHVYFVNDQSIELAKKAFIMRFLKRIPLDQLEKLVDFKAEDVEIEGQYKEASKFSAELRVGSAYKDALENLIIAMGMGWDLDGVRAEAEKLLNLE